MHDGADDRDRFQVGLKVTHHADGSLALVEEGEAAAKDVRIAKAHHLDVLALRRDTLEEDLAEDRPRCDQDGGPLENPAANDVGINGVRLNLGRKVAVSVEEDEAATPTFFHHPACCGLAGGWVGVLYEVCHCCGRVEACILEVQEEEEGVVGEELSLSPQ